MTRRFDPGCRDVDVEHQRQILLLQMMLVRADDRAAALQHELGELKAKLAVRRALEDES